MTGRGPSTRQPRRRLVRSRALTREDSGHSDSGASSDSASDTDRLGLDAEYRRLPGLVSSSSPWPAPPPPQGPAAMATGPLQQQPVPHSELGPSDAPAPTPAPSVISGWRRAAAAARAQAGDSGGLPSQAVECALGLTLSLRLGCMQARVLWAEQIVIHPLQ